MSANNAPTAVDKEQIFGMAEKEMEYRVDLFNKLTQTCFDKCIEKRFKESELHMGENSCIDRCVSKYWQNCQKVGNSAVIQFDGSSFLVSHYCMGTSLSVDMGVDELTHTNSHAVSPFDIKSNL
ncbi:Tim10/DDP family zinc finger [Macleaya cordata]|uniref:Mitochondrial import inner membrane translocase subunit n=1 Tax=Macleaya cordata TaxID=56857 RepID=A0A200QYP8_MACCD|nr:Tim10/DDP family zinc finger [Macleaya cordata]